MFSGRVFLAKVQYVIRGLLFRFSYTVLCLLLLRSSCLVQCARLCFNDQFCDCKHCYNGLGGRRLQYTLPYRYSPRALLTHSVPARMLLRQLAFRNAHQETENSVVREIMFYKDNHLPALTAGRVTPARAPDNVRPVSTLSAAVCIYPPPTCSASDCHVSDGRWSV
jgi:hypothetical protein